MHSLLCVIQQARPNSCNVTFKSQRRNVLAWLSSVDESISHHAPHAKTHCKYPRLDAPLLKKSPPTKLTRLRRAALSLSLSHCSRALLTTCAYFAYKVHIKTTYLTLAEAQYHTYSIPASLEDNHVLSDPQTRLLSVLQSFHAWRGAQF